MINCYVEFQRKANKIDAKNDLLTTDQKDVKALQREIHVSSYLESLVLGPSSVEQRLQTAHAETIIELDKTRRLLRLQVVIIQHGICSIGFLTGNFSAFHCGGASKSCE